MKKILKTRNFADKVSICLSLSCVIHCIGLPLLILLMPSMSSLWVNDELIHLLIVVIAFPTSIYALIKVFGKNNNYKCFECYKCIILMSIGFILLFSAFLLNDYGESVEKLVTIIGATTIAATHIFSIKFSIKNFIK
tara:strand:- start:1411 stop:1821 length:411 start_codon:yes stop_codon:yes gene_type:complete